MTSGRNVAQSTGFQRARADMVAVVALLAAIIVVAWYGYSTAAFLGRTDIVTQYLPWYSYLGEQLRAGNIPGWLPYSFGGAPFAGDPQSGWGYMPAMVIFTIVPGKFGFEALIFFHFLVATFATYAFARAIGLNVYASFIAGAGFTFSGLIERTRCCTIHVEVAVWVPVGLLGIEMGARARRWPQRIAWWVLTGIAMSQVIAGWIGVGAAYGLIAIGSYALYRVLLAPDRDQFGLKSRVTQAVGIGISAGITAGLLAATALIPRLDVVDRSNLAGGSYDGIGGSAAEFGGWTLKEMFDRLLTQDDTSGRYYAGAAILGIALLAPFFARRRYHVPFFTVYGLVVLILLLNTTIVHRIFYLIPSFERLHEHRPPHILTIFPIAPAMLAGAAVMTLFTDRGGRWWRAAIAFVPTIAIIVVREFARDPEPAIRLRMVAVVLASSLVIAGAIIIGRKETTILAAIALSLFVLWDPAFMTVIQKEQSSASATRNRTVDTYARKDAVATWLHEQEANNEPFRFFGYDGMQLVAAGNIRTYHVSYSDPETMKLLVNNRAVQLGLEDIQGYNPVQIQRYVDFIVAVNGMDQSYHAANILFRGVTSPLLNFLNVRYIILPVDVPAGRPDLLHLSQRYPTVYKDDLVRVIERTDALPRAWAVHRLVTAPTDADALAIMKSPKFDPRTTAILPAETAMPTLQEPANPGDDQVVTVQSSPDEIHLDVSLSGTGMVVLSELWDPGWKVEIDGESAPLYRVNSLFRGVVVSQGEHTVVLRYAPIQLVASAWATGIGWALVVIGYIAFGWWWLRDRRRGVGVGGTA